MTGNSRHSGTTCRGRRPHGLQVQRILALVLVQRYLQGHDLAHWFVVVVPVAISVVPWLLLVVVLLI